MTDELTHLIWNTEHGAWWRPGDVGYSVHIEEAGRFTRRQALEECCRVLVGWRPGTPYPDIRVVERDVMMMLDGDAGAATRSNFRAAPELEYQIFLAQFQDAWSFYEHADGDVRADLRETAPQ